MKIVAISDCHGHMPVLPACDLIINAGDICPDFRGDRWLFQHQWLNRHYRDYLQALPAPMVATWGNHDFVGERQDMVPKDLPWTLLRDDLTYVQDLAIYGTPWSKEFFNWAFMRDELTLDRQFGFIPEHLDILIVHGPPYGVGDLNDAGVRCGSKALLSHIHRAQPKLVICGHIHESGGITGKIGNSVIMNVSSVERRNLRDVPYTVIEW